MEKKIIFVENYVELRCFDGTLFFIVPLWVSIFSATDSGFVHHAGLANLITAPCRCHSDILSLTTSMLRLADILFSSL
jgi:hypothetical protein